MEADAVDIELGPSFRELYTRGWQYCIPYYPEFLGRTQRYSSMPFPYSRRILLTWSNLDSIRLLEPGGAFAFTTWHSQNGAWVCDVRDAFASLPSRLLPPDYNFHMPMQLTDDGHWDNVDWLRGALTDQGLVDVQVDVLATLTPIKSPEHFMRTSALMIEYAGKLTLGLDLETDRGKVEEVKEFVKKHLVEKYGKDGKWTLTWVSIIASGRKPS